MKNKPAQPRQAGLSELALRKALAAHIMAG